MQFSHPAWPPWICRSILRSASWLVPSGMRHEWRTRRTRAVDAWWTLVERGDLTIHSFADELTSCWRAFPDAVLTRCSRESLRSFLRGPHFPMAVAVGLATITAVLTRGFSEARRLVAIARTGDATDSDAVVASVFLLLFALAAGVVAATRRGMPVVARGWRAWSCLGVKTLGIVALIPIVWLEITCILWPRMPDDATRAWLCGILMPVAFIAALSSALAWNVGDQARRCPVCLSRLGLPVRLGSWASTFDPPTTELVCEHGHGCLCLIEIDQESEGRWLPLDPSWQELFEVKAS